MSSPAARTEPLQRRDATGEIAVAAGLDDFHRRVQVNAQSVGTDSKGDRPHLGGRQLPSLDDAEIPEHQGPRRDVANLVGAGRGGIHVHRPLAAEPERVAARLGDRRELAVDGPRALDSAGHRGDDEGRGKPLPEERERGVDPIDRELGKRLVDEPHTLEKRGGAAKADISGGRQIDVVALA
jgi:hypothetical protein